MDEPREPTAFGAVVKINTWETKLAAREGSDPSFPWKVTGEIGGWSWHGLKQFGAPITILYDPAEVEQLRADLRALGVEYDRVVVERDEALRRMRVAQVNAEARLQSAMVANERANELQARIDDALRALGSDEQVHGQMSLFDGTELL